MKTKNKKQLISSSAAYILGMRPQVEIKGSGPQIKRFKEVLEASKNLYCVLQEGSTEDVEVALEQKNQKAKNFSREFGWRWPF